MAPDVLPLIRFRANLWYVHNMTSSVFSPWGLSAETRAWESKCLQSDMWCRDKMHVVITYNMFWYVLHQKSCAYKSQCLHVCVHVHARLCFMHLQCVPTITSHNTKKNMVNFSFLRAYMWISQTTYVNSAVSVDTPYLWPRLGMGN